MPISRSRARDGSSSTTIAMFFIASRKRRGIDASASATSFSNRSRCTAGFRNDGVEVLALRLDRAAVAERLRPADAAAVQDERIGRSRPARLWQRAAELLFDEHWIVTLGDAD